jgi:two-component system, chemotaxis family, CheB/CheR fusion protein
MTCSLTRVRHESGEDCFMTYRYPISGGRVTRRLATGGSTQFAGACPAVPVAEAASLSSLANSAPAQCAQAHTEPVSPKGARHQSTGGTARSREEQKSRIRALEEQLRRSEAERSRLEAMLGAVDEGIVVVDEIGTVVHANDAYRRMFGGLPAADDDLVEPALPPFLLERQAGSGAAFTVEFTQADADGTRRWYEAHGEPILLGSSGRWGDAVAIRDITERSLHRLQNEFMARVSHELGAPLAAIILSLRLLLRRRPVVVDAAGSPSSESEEFRSYAETALWEAERMRVLVGDLLDMSRLQRGKLTLRLQPEDLTTLLRRAVSLAQLGTRSQTLTLELPKAPVVVCGDATRLEQVVVNLLGNAMKHAPESERIDVRLNIQRSEAELQVQDYGPGISSDDLPHLFKRFFGAAASMGAVQTGLGLGLYITKELVDAHGGRISVESRQGEGALFIVRLPLFEQPSESAYMCTVASVPEPG